MVLSDAEILHDVTTYVNNLRHSMKTLSDEISKTREALETQQKELRVFLYGHPIQMRQKYSEDVNICEINMEITSMTSKCSKRSEKRTKVSFWRCFVPCTAKKQKKRKC
ncbi:hypothetical protein FKM82_026838 [Ascaphus truei]